MNDLRDFMICMALFVVACLGAIGFAFLIFYVEALLQ